VGNNGQPLFEVFREHQATGFGGDVGAKRQQFASRMCDKLKEANENLHAISSRLTSFCSRGCVHCCKHIFSASLAEAAAITYYLTEHPALVSGFLDISTSLDVAYPDRRTLRVELSPHERELEYFSRKIPCDFLGADGDCMIYPVRPLSCSAYVSYAPARICSFEPKGHIPVEARKSYMDYRHWFEAESRRNYPGSAEQSYIWPFVVRENLLNGCF
jgi:Fe-S-cluster containining protein